MGLDKASVLRVRSTLPSNKNTKTEKAVHLELDERTTYPFISQTHVDLRKKQLTDT